MTSRLLVVVADGVRPDVLADEIDQGRVPALAALQARGGLHAISAAFPSVTGPAYVPFVMGRHPALVGMPGLRWFDRTRSLRWSLGHSRSYSGIDIWHIDRDLARDVPTVFDLARPSLAGLMMIGRGASHGRVGRGVRWMMRASGVHFRGDLLGWRRIEQQAVQQFFTRFARVRPRLSMLGILSADKFAHAFGSDSEVVRESIRDIDRAVARAQEIARADGWDNDLRVWVVGDHGHAPVSQHDDLHSWLEGRGLRVLAHPQLKRRRADVALMVGGNAMAHVYLDPSHTVRSWWPSLAQRWASLLHDLLARPSIDIAAVCIDVTTVRVFHAERGSADVTQHEQDGVTRYSYTTVDGDPLQLGGSLALLNASDAWHATTTTSYPDAIVQLASLVPAARSGDIVISAAPDWDLRARFEPITHVSTHGALLRDQMMVPLLLDAPPARVPQRTTDEVPSALDVLGVDTGALRFDGRSFY